MLNRGVQRAESDDIADWACVGEITETGRCERASTDEAMRAKTKLLSTSDIQVHGIRARDIEWHH